MTYGFWRVGQGIREHKYVEPPGNYDSGEGLWGMYRRKLTGYSELAREKMWARIYLIPALQAEEDRDQVRRYLADKAREKELLGSETRVYHSDRYVNVVGVDRGCITNRSCTDLFDQPSL